MHFIQHQHPLQVVTVVSNKTIFLQVNLSTTLGKPVIPLLMEKMQWPPPGSMGPIFGEYLFIRFFQRGDTESTGDDRYWPEPKFQELLMQLRYTIPPDESMLSGRT